MLKNTCKILLGKKADLFFRVAFPVLYSVVFLLSISGIINDEVKFDPVKIAVQIQTDSETENQQAGETGQAEQTGQTGQTEGSEQNFAENSIKEILTSIEQNNDYVEFTYVTDATAGENLLADKKVSSLAVIKAKDGKLSSTLEYEEDKDEYLNNSIAYNIINTFVQTYNITYETYQEYFTNIALQGGTAEDFAAANEKLTEAVNREFARNYVEELPKNGNTNSLTSFLYSGLAYICIYFMSSGYAVIQLSDPTLEKAAMREAVSRKSKNYFIMLRFALITVLSVLLTYLSLFIYIRAGVPMGDNIPAILLLLLLGVMAGLSMGMLVGALEAKFAKKETVLSNVLCIGTPLVFAYISGMMGTGPRYMSLKHPGLYRYNPVGVISTAFHFLYNYPTMQAYWQNIGVLLIYIVASLLLVALLMRRKTYDSL